MRKDVNIGGILAKRAALHPDKDALFDVAANRRFTFRELNARANRFANGLLSLGMKPGDRVAMLCHNGHHYFEAIYGAAKAGIVLMPLNWRLTERELTHILLDGGATALVFSSEFTPVVESLRAAGAKGSVVEHWIEIEGAQAAFAHKEDLFDRQPDAEPPPGIGDDDNLYIMYTSGTTGLPKGAVHTHRSQFWVAISSLSIRDVLSTDTMLHLLPMFHVGPLAGCVLALYRGCSQVVERRFDATRAWQIIQDERISIMTVVPALLEAMLRVPDFKRFDYSSMRSLAAGGSPLSLTLLESYRALGMEIFQAYGLTEACGGVSLLNPRDAVRKTGWAGKPGLHTEVRIAGRDNETLPPNTVGEICVRGRQVMKGYWQNPKATAAAIDADGWLHTGDLGVLDEEGFIQVRGRVKDMIISGGENVYPAEIESILVQHPGIKDVAVIGRPSPRWGESAFAVIAKASADLTEAEVLSFCEGKLAGFKRPRGVAFMDELPRNASNKVLKTKLRELFSAPLPE
jgi:acyl-CoA synthetase (AMP-forming)/AMP-acid ligase II